MIHCSTDIAAALRSRQRGFFTLPGGMGAVKPSGGGATDPLFSYVTYLLHMDGSNESTTFTDEIGATWTNVNTNISTTEAKWGGASGDFTGNQDLIYAESDAKHEFGTGTFCIEFWGMRKSSSGGGDRHIIDAWPNRFLIRYESATNLQVFVKGVGEPLFSVSQSWPVDTWKHVALERDGNTWNLLFDGTRIGTTTSSASVGATANILRIGTSSTGQPGTPQVNGFGGYIDDFRVTKGHPTPRYTISSGTYTVPTAVFPNS